jgi:hypothetical protein
MLKLCEKIWTVIFRTLDVTVPQAYPSHFAAAPQPRHAAQLKNSTEKKLELGF